MQHVVEVDQSGKFEDTQGDTVLAFANGSKYSVKVSATTKRKCIQILRVMGEEGTVFYLKLFSITLFFLLKNHIESLSRVTIDPEYLGKEKQIKEYLINFLKRGGCKVSPDQIHFWHIGKNSPAHHVAWNTRRGDIKPNCVLTLEEILGQYSPKKIGDPLRGNA